MSTGSVTFSPAHYGNTLLAGLSSLLTEAAFTDVTLVVEGSEFKTHRIILSACSRYFRAMFVGQLSEVSKEQVGIHGVQSAIFGDILRFIYTGKLLAIIIHGYVSWILLYCSPELGNTCISLCSGKVSMSFSIHISCYLCLI